MNKLTKEKHEQLEIFLKAVNESIDKIVILPSYRTKYTDFELDEAITGIKAALIDLHSAVENIGNQVYWLQMEVEKDE